MGRLRWNPFHCEWAIVTPRRASRLFQEEEYTCSFYPGSPETEGDWRVLILDNRFPSLTPETGIIPLDGNMVVGIKLGEGTYTNDSTPEEIAQQLREAL
jgi:galactose-1-phosphate uridylyltransferase